MRIGKFIPAVLAAWACCLGAGCDKYNRADISPDGRTIVFSLGEKGFVTDNTSEMYSFDVDNCSLRRLTVDTQCDSWASLNESSVLFMKGEQGGGGIYLADIGSSEVTPLVNPFADTPVWIGKGAFFFTSIRMEEKKIVFNIWTPYAIRPLVSVPTDKTKSILFSTLPAFYKDEKLYYAVAEHPTASHPKAFVVAVYALDINTKENRQVAGFEFPPGTKANDNMSVGYVDLAISPDSRYLVCCFLPPNKFSLAEFSDRLNSKVYLVDVKTGEKRLFSSDKNMYYPQWKPAAATASRPAKEPLAFLYLSGTGYAEGRGVWITDLDGKTRKLADLPDKVMQGYTGWTWLTASRVRIFHVGRSGLYLIDVNEDGTRRTTRFLTREKLSQLKVRADLAALIDYLKKQTVETATLLNGRAKLPSESYEKTIKDLAQKLNALQKEPVGYERE